LTSLVSQQWGDQSIYFFELENPSPQMNFMGIAPLCSFFQIFEELMTKD